jgi:hypothetical protein
MIEVDHGTRRTEKSMVATLGGAMYLRLDGNAWFNLCTTWLLMHINRCELKSAWHKVHTLQMCYQWPSARPILLLTVYGSSQNSNCRAFIILCNIPLSVFITTKGWSWSYGSWICNCLSNQYISPLTLWVRI